MIQLLFALATVNPALGVVNFHTGNDVYRYCTIPESLDACLGYVEGVTDSLSASPAQAPICVPDGVEGGQIKDVVVNYLRAHPETRQTSGASIIHAALYQAFPCR